MARLEPRKEDRLSSWKEIAAYLGCDERTCLRWEKNLGLPVHRMEGTPKSRVFAFQDELDRWMRERITLAGARPRPSGRAAGLLRVFGPAAALAAAALGIFWLRSSKASVPADFRVEDSNLVILNKKGRALWSYNTELFNLKSESFYRGRFQIKIRSQDDDARFPLLMIKDIDEDGRVDVLLALKTQDEFNEGRLIRFNDRGKPLWEFSTGRELQYDGVVYARDYRIQGFDLHDFDGDGRPEIFLIAYHKPDFPCQLAVLSLAGELVGEYWNAGFFSDVAFSDLDRDGREEVLAAGINNEYGKGCLVVFDPGRIGGSSPQRQGSFICKNLAPGSELYYLLFPRTDMDLSQYPVESIKTIDPLRNGRFYLNALVSRIFFEISPALDAVYVHSSHRFQRQHAEAVRNGLVRSRLDPEYFERLRRGVLYWNGTDWVPERTPNLRNVPAR